MSSELFSQFLNGLAIDSFPLLNPTLSFKDYVALDLSINNIELQTIDVSSSEKLALYIANHIAKNNASVAYGGYLETRNIYNRSDYFNTSEEILQRNIHLGLDLWIASGTSIYSPLEGVVHSFKNNTNFGDYGPTIILQHDIQDSRFYTLYGHLSLSSIVNLKVGQKFNKGDEIATLGDASVNGDYPPHLHFQIIKDIQHYVGDYPGVCSKQDLEFYKHNCPNPNLVLKL
ncbi:peptidoglycan DD-metalloendopeptidase family protein [Psychroserpens sp.]|uniref:peptidoglycan DD-metalloendopeptidase family protein n=1 Tax=Psychroserpens sp. TaxID=2020870 RepID=UPI003859E09C